MNVLWREREGKLQQSTHDCVYMQACECACTFMRGIHSTFIQDKCIMSLSHLILSPSSFSKEINQVPGVTIRHHIKNKVPIRALFCFIIVLPPTQS